MAAKDPDTIQPIPLLHDLPDPGTGECFEDLLRLGPVRIERIVSSPVPEDRLYDQAQDEWVLLLQGEARLWVEGAEIALGPGDSLFLPAHTRHRVVATSTEPRCVWVAVHIEQAPGGGRRFRSGPR